MERQFLKSRDLLQATGAERESEVEVPQKYRHLLIASVLKCVSSPAVARFLRENGHDVTDKTVTTWLQSMRAWLGLPAAGRGKTSAKYRKAVEEWFHTNGSPTLEEIDAGWLPAHRKPQRMCQSRDLSPLHLKHIEELRMMLNRLEKAIDDNHARALLAEFQQTLKKSAPFRIEPSSQPADPGPVSPFEPESATPTSCPTKPKIG